MHTALCPWHRHVASTYTCRREPGLRATLASTRHQPTTACHAAPPAAPDKDSAWASKLLSATVKKRRKKKTGTEQYQQGGTEGSNTGSNSSEGAQQPADWEEASSSSSAAESTPAAAVLTTRNFKRRTNDRPVVVKTVEPEELTAEETEDLDWEDFADLPEDDDDESDADFVGTHNKLPSEVRCFDTAKICVRSGNGGNGCVAFRREKFVEKGGPSGGDGGRGGNVWAVVDSSLNSLLSFRRQVHWRADGGIPGTGSQCRGADAKDLLVPVPPGTIIREVGADETSRPLAELLKEGDRALLLAGGRGGRGNASFKTNRNNAPVFAENGEEGQEMWVELELKLVADVGIIGVPNAGKSTFLAGITAAKPKIANYPFTTLVPNLGVCELDYRTTVFADVPGLMEGAHEGLGLGHEFLRHVQRCRALVHVVDGTSPDPLGDFYAINLELELFNPALKDKPQVVVYNKVDIPDSEVFWGDVKEALLEGGVKEEDIFAVSAATKQGVWEVVRRVRHLLDELPKEELVYTTEALNRTRAPRLRTDARIDDYSVRMEDAEGVGRVFVVEGEAVERFAQMTNWDYYEAIKRFQRVMDVAGISTTLQKKGVKEGDTVVIGPVEFNWSDDRSSAALYSAYVESMAGRPRMGSAAWPKNFD